MKKSILIVDDHPIFRDGLKIFLEQDGKYAVVAEAGNGASGLELARSKKPVFAVLDISLPDMSGLDLVRRIRKESPLTRSVILSMHSKVDYVGEALDAGAYGYVVKDSARGNLLDALVSAELGNYYLDPALSGEIARKAFSPRAPINGGQAAYERLTPREREIMRLVAQGIYTKEIAEKLNISPKTVENHRSSLMRKLGVRNSVELVRLAAGIGLIDLDTWMD